MAGSYRHIVNANNEFIGLRLLENGRDVYDALEECYDMIQWLSGGDKQRIFEAWRDGHLYRRASLENAERFGKYEIFWHDDAADES